MSAGPSVELRDVAKRYGDSVAVKRATITLAPGEVHAIVGENGAGKSTLLKMAAGVTAPSEGEVFVGGRKLEPATPAEAYRRGVGMVHQHFMLIGAFRAIENLALGHEPLKGALFDEREAMKRAEALAGESGLHVRLDALTDDLTVGERQRLEILRVLYRGAGALLLDEPTAVLSPLEADELYATLRKLAERGRSIAVVTHRLDEVTRFADRVTVMRRGEITFEGKRGEADEARLTRAIMGGDLPSEATPPAIDASAEETLVITGLTVVDREGRKLVDALDLKVKAGEIVGVAGVEGNGQRELVRAVAGLDEVAGGSIAIGGRDVTRLDVPARRAFLAVVHEDRQVEGLLLDAPLSDNLVLGEIGEIDEAGEVHRRLEDFDVRPRDPHAIARSLSGGNQQKVVVARALDRFLRGDVVRGAAAVLAQPTRGVDVGAAAVIHRAVFDAAARRLAVVVVSADLAELRKVAHRLVVIHRGKIVATFPPDAPSDAIGRAMLGLEAA